MKYANVDSARKFAQHMVPHVVRPAQIIWNKAIGAVFLLLAVGIFSSAHRYFKTLDTNPGSRIGFVFAMFFGAVLAFYGIASFMKARRISRLLKPPVS